MRYYCISRVDCCVCMCVYMYRSAAKIHPPFLGITAWYMHPVKCLIPICVCVCVCVCICVIDCKYTFCELCEVMCLSVCIHMSLNVSTTCMLVYQHTPLPYTWLVECMYTHCYTIHLYSLQQRHYTHIHTHTVRHTTSPECILKHIIFIQVTVATTETPAVSITEWSDGAINLSHQYHLQGK